MFCVMGAATKVWPVFALVAAFLLAGCGAVFREDPTVLVTLLIRNKAHTLPYFLRLFEELDYPKDRMVLWIKSEENQDRTLEILEKWIPSVEGSYKKVLHDMKPATDPNAPIPLKWTPERFKHIIALKEEALNKGREIWADYVWYLDCDVFVTNNQTLKSLVKTNYPVVAPMLDSLSLYSNFWCGMGLDYYYRRTDEYKPIREREKKGCYRVILVHSNFLIDLRQVEALKLAFSPDQIKGYEGPHDDIITLAIAAFWNDVPIYVCNNEKYGYIMVPSEDGQTMEDEFNQMLHVKQDASVDFPPMVPHTLLEEFVKYPPKDKLGFSEIFVINLRRRPDRLRRMQWVFQDLGLDYKLVEAVDGRSLNDSYVIDMGIKMLPNFADPYHHRAMTMGEIGCFLSHMNIWAEMVDRKLETGLVFEDDIRFEPYFRQKVNALVDEAKRLQLDWDLIYLGRKRLQLNNESWVEGSDSIVNVAYSYWTLSYAISLSGARKLLAGEPLTKLVPVDEYLPIMFNKHPEQRWAQVFPNRNLKAFSAAPLLVYPTHYTGELGYISDTESSEIVPEEIRINSAPGKGSKESIAIEADLPVDLATPAAAVVDNLQLDEIRSEL